DPRITVEVDLGSGTELLELPGGCFVKRGAITPGTHRNLDLDGGGSPGGRSGNAGAQGGQHGKDGSSYFQPVRSMAHFHGPARSISEAGRITLICVLAEPTEIRIYLDDTGWVPGRHGHIQCHPRPC